MACRKTLTLSEAVSGEVSLDNAVVGSFGGETFIWAVRGGRVFKFNATTGARISDSVFDSELLSNSAIAYDGGNEIVYATGYNRAWSQSSANFTNNYPSWLYGINPDTLAVTSMVNMTLLSGWGTNAHGTVATCLIGTQRMFYALNGLWGQWHVDSNTSPFRYVPSAPYIMGVGSLNNKTNGYSDVDWDGIDRMFFADVWNQSLRAYIMTSNGAAWNFDASYNCWTENNTIPFGVAYDPGSTDIFLGLQNGTVKRVSYNQGTSTIALVANIATGLSGAIFTMRYNPYDALIYGVSISEGKVFTVNPSDNSVAVKAATFTLPWEVVFTPTHNWLVTRGDVGIVELT